jgi:hypothetical protein
LTLVLIFRAPRRRHQNFLLLQWHIRLQHFHKHLFSWYSTEVSHQTRFCRNYFSRIEEENPLTDKDTGNYQVRSSVGQIDLSQSKDYQHDSFNYPPKDIQMSSTPRFPSTSRNSHHALFSESLIQKNRPIITGILIS